MHFSIAPEVFTELLVGTELRNSAFELKEYLFLLFTSNLSELELCLLIKCIEARLVNALDYIGVVSHGWCGM